jgi:hypothetical protein
MSAERLTPQQRQFIQQRDRSCCQYCISQPATRPIRYQLSTLFRAQKAAPTISKTSQLLAKAAIISNTITPMGLIP